jgi:hypothetical protein
MFDGLVSRYIPGLRFPVLASVHTLPTAPAVRMVMVLFFQRSLPGSPDGSNPTDAVRIDDA